MTTTQKIKDLLPQIKARRADIEEGRRVPADIAETLQAAGVYALAVPRALGGDELPQADLMRTYETIASADGSTGWCAMIGSGIVAGFLSEAGAKEVYADPTAPVAGIAGPMGQAVRVDGGVRVSGKWSPASGISHSDWVWGGAMVFDNGAPVMTPHGPEIIHIMAPKSDVKVNDNWLVSGLCGTASNEFAAQDLFVPEHLVWSLFDGSTHRPEPLYQMPGIAQFSSMVAAVSLGIARAALDEVTEIAQTRTPPMSLQPLADKPYAHIELARAEVALESARSFLYDTVEDTWQTVSAGREVTPKQNAFGRMAATNAVEVAARVAQIASRLGGTHAIYKDSSLQRHARDTEVITHHFTQSCDVFEQGGRILLDRPPTVPMF